MRRWIVLLLLIWMPLQLSWAAAMPLANIGGDAAGGSAGQHLMPWDGHAAAQSVIVQAKSSVVDSDCASCHAQCSAAVSAPAHTIPAQVSRLFSADLQKRLVSVSSDIPDRPQWLAPI